MAKKVILTGIRANNDLHIGNYFGALLPIVDMAKERSKDYEVNLMLADLHSFSTPVDHSLLYQQIQENLRAFIAAGLPLNEDTVRLFRESYIPAHSELAMILSSFSGFGEVSRMTQFKDKSAKLSNDRVSVGLFNYPILMAADILLYQTSFVPVGEDQTQHLEFARDIAERLNNKFDSDILTVPESVKAQHKFFGKDQGLRIKDLSEPTKKMSKSDTDGKGIIFLNDQPTLAAQKIMSATTDSFGRISLDFERQPGISNLLQIHALLSGETLDNVAQHHEGESNYGQLKQEVAGQVSEFLIDFQKKFNQVTSKDLETILKKSERAMNEMANKTLAKVQKAVGLRK